MKAAILSAIGAPIQIQEIPEPKQPGKEEVVVRLRAAALNHRDIWIQKGQYAKIKLPITLGSDGSGIVTAIGDKVDSKWLGQEVIINPNVNWGNNDTVQDKNYCILGMPNPGTFAEYIQIPADRLHPKPAHLSFEEAAAYPLAGLTAFRAMIKKGSPRPGDTALVTGIGGGVALNAMQFAIAAGAKVYVSSGSENKISKAIDLGATGGAIYHHSDFIKELLLQAPEGFDIIVDGAAGPGFNRLLDAAKPGGKIIFYGGHTGNITDVVPAKVFWRQLTIMGSTMGSDQDFSEMTQFINERQLRPVIDACYPLERVAEAFAQMESGRQFGKIILQIPW
jgi:NADPH:quinone reductase-like Zn-dependent oxidoreductase